MNELVAKVYEAEKEARALVEQARNEVQEERKRLDQELAEMLSAARTEAALILKDGLKESREKAEAERLRLVEAARSEAVEYKRSRSDSIERALDSLVERLSGSEIGTA